ncbi:MAG TPA: phosphoserine phosphatase SerB [Croceibacterium sp.]|nr:phosphoserine phosphatase SerB [Croceibacterium sp.]
MSATAFFSGDFPLLIARLIADTDTLEPRLDALNAALAAEGMPVAAAVLLDHWSDVLQLTLPHGDAATLRRAVDAHLGPTDAIVSDRDFRIPDLFVSDMDSTMIEQECIDELADFAGFKDKVSAITERAMQGELDFASALRERVGLLAGLEEGAIATCLAERITPMPGARTLVATLKHFGCRTVLVTGGFHHFADPVAEDLGFERVVANRLAVAEGNLAGELVGGITDSTVKAQVLAEEMQRLGENAISLATGDGANDIPMLQAADWGVAYHAKPKAREAANGWIGRGDLTSILKLLEIPEHDWQVR